MAVSLLTVKCWSQISTAVLSTPISMCYSGAMRGEKILRWAMYAASSRSLMVKNPWGFSIGENVGLYGGAECSFFSLWD